MTAEPRRAAPFVGLLAAILGLVLAAFWLRGGSRERDAGEPGEPLAHATNPTPIAAPATVDTTPPRVAIDAPPEVPPAAAEPEVPIQPPVTAPARDEADYWGRTIDESTGAPLAGVRVVPRDERDENLAHDSLAVAPAATSDADGRFRLRWSGWKPHVLELDGYGVALLLPDGEHRDPTAPQELHLLPDATLLARLDGVWEGRLSLSTRAYEIVVPDGVFLGGTEAHWTVPLVGGGVTQLTLPARVPLVVEYVPPEGETRRLVRALVLEPGERREVEWRVGTGAVLTGRVIDQDGQPVAGADVGVARRILAGDPKRGRAFSHTSDRDELFAHDRTDRQGAFRLEDLEPGKWWAGLTTDRRDGDFSARTPAAVVTVAEIPPGQSLVEVELQTWRGLAIRGVVLDPDGVPAPNERVDLRASSGDLRGFLNGRSAEDGTFAIGPLVPGEYRLSAGSFGQFARGEEVTAEAGAEDVELHLDRPGSIRGVVVEGATGKRLAAELWISKREGVRVGTSADEKGEFLRGKLEAGTYDLVARTRDGLAGVVEGIEVVIGLEAGPVRVDLEPGALLAVRYTGPSTYSNYTIFRGRVPAAFNGLQSGTSETCVVPAGALRVELRLSDGRKEVREVTLAPGERHEVAFELE